MVKANRSRSKSPTRSAAGSKTPKTSSVRSRKPAVNKKFKEIFDRLDADGNGVITADEIHAAMLTDFGAKLSKFEVKKMMKMADLDGNGVVDFDEFTSLMASFETAAGGKKDAVAAGLWQNIKNKADEGIGALEVMMESMQDAIEEHAPAVVDKKFIVQYATWQTRTIGFILSSLLPTIVALVSGLFFAIGIPMMGASVPYQTGLFHRVEYSGNPVFYALGSALVIAGVVTASMIVVYPLYKRRTWSQLLMGTRLVTEGDFADVTLGTFILKNIVFFFLFFLTPGLPIIDFLFVTLGSSPGASAADKMCGTRVIHKVVKA